MKKILNSLIWVAIGGIFLFLTLKGKPLDEMFRSIGQADLLWVGMNGLALIAAFFLRGMRWRILLQNGGENPRLIYVLYSLCMGFFVNSFTPRFGEVARCTTLKTSTNTPIPKSLATMVTERMWDVLVLFLGLAVVFILEVNRLAAVWKELMTGINKMVTDNALLLVLIVVGLIGLVLLAWYILKKRKVFDKARDFIAEFWQTLKLSFKIKKYPQFIILTVLIWLVLAFMNLFSLMALPETADYSFYFAFVVLFVAGIGWAIPSPSGIGTTHFIILQLFIAFQLPETTGAAFAVLSNGLTFIYTILIGGFSLIAYQLLTRKSSKLQTEGAD